MSVKESTEHTNRTDKTSLIKYLKTNTKHTTNKLHYQWKLKVSENSSSNNVKNDNE